MSEKMKESMLSGLIKEFVNVQAGTELERLIVEQMMDLLHDDIVYSC